MSDIDPMEAEMTKCAFASIFTQAGNPHTVSKARLLKVAAFAAGLGLGTLSCAVHAAPASGGDTVRGLYDALLNTMKNGRTLGQSGRFAKLDPVIRRSFDIAEMARLSLGRSWAGLPLHGRPLRRSVSSSRPPSDRCLPIWPHPCAWPS